MQINFVLGVPGCTPATVSNLCWMVNSLPSNATWTATGVGKSAFQIAAAAIAMGGNVRVGFEDNLYLEKGVLAKSNGELVAKAVRIAKELGREIANPDEARKILGLKNI
jgi:3-keto-5-aminohexanoate cleavage enzyme